MKRLAKSIAQILVWIVAVWALYIAVVLRWYPADPPDLGRVTYSQRGAT